MKPCYEQGPPEQELHFGFFVGLGAAIVFLLLLAAAWAQQPKVEAGSQNGSPPAPTAASVEKEAPKPSPELLRAWEKLQSVAELRAAELRRREQAIQELASSQIALGAFNGQLERLSAEFRKLIPAGYRWDAATKSLLKIEEKKEESPK